MGSEMCIRDRGLYLVKVILEKHRASCTIENTPQGVRAQVQF